MGKNSFKRGDSITPVSDSACALAISVSKGSVYDVFVREGEHVFLDDDGDARHINNYARYYGLFKLAERNPMPELEAGMAFETDNGGRYLYINEDYAIKLDGVEFIGDVLNANGDGGWTVVKVYNAKRSAFNGIGKYLGDPIWQRSDNSAELEQLAELKKTISEAQGTIQDAQKQADALEDVISKKK